MSDSIISTALLGARSDVQGLGNEPSPGIIGLFVQGLEAGLVFAQLSSWLSGRDRTDSLPVVILTVFVTTVGFIQTGVSFASAWRIYVENFGQPVVPGWTEQIQALLTTIIAAPIQSFLLWRCYNIVRGNLYIIIPLVSLLLGSIVLSILVTVGLFLHNFHGSPVTHRGPALWSPFLLYNAFPAVLDISVSYILFHHLTQMRRRIYTEQKRQQVKRLITIVWQSAVPPTFCTVAVLLTYIVLQHFDSVDKQMWYPTLQAMVGKLYVLSLFYNLNTRTLFNSDRSTATTYINTLTMPTLDGTSPAGLNTCEVRQSTHDVSSVHPLDGFQQ